MHLLHLTSDQIQNRCTEQSFTRGTDYFHAGAIGNPMLHGYTLSATCQGTETAPYRITVEFMPTTIADTHCSCPYSGEGECKHIVALLLTYIHAQDTICSVDTLLAELAKKPKGSLLRVISELLKRTPALVLVVRVYADTAEESGSAPVPPDHKRTVCATVPVYREQIDRLFGDGFLEQHQLHHVLVQLEGLVQHAESLARVGETEFAISVLHALIHQSIVRYPDTLQKDELPRFVKQCAKRFVRIAANAQGQPSCSQTAQTDSSRYIALLDLSFEAAPVFTPILTHLLEQRGLMQHEATLTDLQATIAQRLDESPDRRAHVQLLLACYLHTGKTEDYLRLARAEAEGYRLIHRLFTLRRDDAAWAALTAFSLTLDEYWCLLQCPIARRVPEFTEKLLTLLSERDINATMALYQRLIEQVVLSRKHEGYEKVRGYLCELRLLYQHLG